MVDTTYVVNVNVNFDVLLTVHLSIIFVINQLNAQNLVLLLHASTCFEHYVLIIRRSELYYTASGIITLKLAGGLKF